MANKKALEQAAEEAIASSRIAFHARQKDAFTLIRRANVEIERLSGAPVTSASGQFVKVVREQAAEIKELFRRQTVAIESFNIVLFGRTGSGKSTLIEALVRGSGVSVSPGESDWTTDVQPKIWGPCKAASSVRSAKP